MLEKLFISVTLIGIIIMGIALITPTLTFTFGPTMVKFILENPHFVAGFTMSVGALIVICLAPAIWSEHGG